MTANILTKPRVQEPFLWQYPQVEGVLSPYILFRFNNYYAIGALLEVDSILLYIIIAFFPKEVGRDGEGMEGRKE